MGATGAKVNNGTPKNQTHYYRPQTPKEKVKEDFKLILDSEIKKLKFDVII